jgi:EAL domain-containing protein (putative c-di-GMP-specific phosphodiesterase class I)
MDDADPKDVRSWSGPIKNLADDERRSLLDSMRTTPAPRIALTEALRNSWFEIWYQPKIDLKRKYLAGAEAMARIRHPQLGVLQPGNFLAQGDDDGLAELAQHAFLATLFDWTVFEEAGFNLHLAINVPVSVVLKLPIPRLIAQYRPNSRRWPGLILELTEDQIARGVEAAAAIANHLRVTGITIAIDDFGAGYSSFGSLRALPFRELKIDRSFVKGCATDATNAAICQTAIDLAHRFGGTAVAEGVENSADLQALMVMGCDFGQGALIAPPMPKARFLELLRQRMSKPRGEATKDAAKAVSKAAPPAAGRVA